MYFFFFYYYYLFLLLLSLNPSRQINRKKNLNKSYISAANQAATAFKHVTNIREKLVLHSSGRRVRGKIHKESYFLCVFLSLSFTHTHILYTQYTRTLSLSLSGRLSHAYTHTHAILFPVVRCCLLYF